MTFARARFLDNIRALRHSAQLPVLLKPSVSAPKQEHSARLLRNGLAVVAFATLEDFIGSRIEEVLEYVSRSHVSFDDLPQRLQVAATQGVIGALQTQVRIHRQTGRDPTLVIQDAGRALASTTGSSLSLSPLALRWTGSNLGVEDLGEMLRVMGVKGGYNEMTRVVRRAGLLNVDCRAAFMGLASDRHAAAHQASYDTPITSVRSAPRSLIAVALGFDALISRAGRLCFEGSSEYLSGSRSITAADITMEFVDDRGGQYAERAEHAGRARKLHDTEEEAMDSTVRRARRDNALVVSRDQTSEPVSWRVSDLP